MDVTDALLWAFAALIVYKLLDYAIRIPRIGGLSDKYVMITGCDTGFGHAAAKRLDGLGMHVFAACLTDKGETELRKSCSSKLKTLHLDVCDENSLKKAFEFVNNNIPIGKGLWGLFNNAGILGILGPVDWLNIKHYHEVMNVNVMGLVNTTMTFLPLVKQARGRIINTSSIGGRLSDNLLTPYCMTKYCVESFSDGLRRQMKSFGVTVSMIEPGFTTTYMTDLDFTVKNINRSWKECPKHIQEEYGEEYKDQLIACRTEALQGPINSSKVYQIIDAYEHAVTATFPRARYMVGFFTKWLFWPLTNIHEYPCDWILAKISKMPVPKDHM